MAAVSTCIISYNQEKYIAQAIESALMQQCAFDHEIIICDDCSTDRTQEIIQQYAEKNSQKIKVHSADKNMGMLKNWERALKLCTGKYIALLEGDDFWTDEKKLQKQFQILENNSAYSVSFTNAFIQYESGENKFSTYVTETSEIYSTVDLFKYNFIPTASVLMRNNISENFFPSAYFKSPFADWIIHVLNSQFGKIHFLNEFACTYRVHDAGIWGGIKEEKQLKNKLQAVNCIDEIILSTELKKGIRSSRAETLQKLCTYYKNRNEIVNYLKYRIQLLLN